MARFSRLICTAICTGLFPVSATAAGPSSLPRAAFLTAIDGEFRKMDADKNGVLIRAEIEAFQRIVAVAESGKRNRALFAQLDKDANGQISPVEFAALNAPARIDPQPLLARYDSNRDGKVSQVEYRSVKLDRFDRIDADQNGIVTTLEQRASDLDN